MIGSDVHSLAIALLAALDANHIVELCPAYGHGIACLTRELCTYREHVCLLPEKCVRSLLSASLRSMLGHALSPAAANQRHLLSSMCLSSAALLAQLEPLAVCKVSEG